MNGNKNYKDRDLSLYQFFLKLQLEYLVAELRRKIYPATSDKKYYQKLMEQKKEKIDDIALRNKLDSIFTNPETKNELRSQIYNSKGFPNFLYKANDCNREKNMELDKKFYYAVESEVKVEIEGKTKIGYIKFVSFKTNTVNVELIDGSIINVGLDLITRIL